MPSPADPAYLSVINRARRVMATYADMEEELLRLGAYRTGSSQEVDEAIRLHQPLKSSRSRKPKTNFVLPVWGLALGRAAPGRRAFGPDGCGPGQLGLPVNIRTSGE
jgi:hypothetical protein